MAAAFDRLEVVLRLIDLILPDPVGGPCLSCGELLGGGKRCAVAAAFAGRHLDARPPSGSPRFARLASAAPPRRARAYASIRARLDSLSSSPDFHVLLKATAATTNAVPAIPDHFNAGTLITPPLACPTIECSRSKRADSEWERTCSQVLISEGANSPTFFMQTIRLAHPCARKRWSAQARTSAVVRSQ